VRNTLLAPGTDCGQVPGLHAYEPEAKRQLYSRLSRLSPLDPVSSDSWDGPNVDDFSGGHLEAKLGAEAVAFDPLRPACEGASKQLTVGTENSAYHKL
jgi:hypothetical protein